MKNRHLPYSISLIAFLIYANSPLIQGQSGLNHAPNEQYKKHPREAMALIATGQADDAIKRLHDYLGKHPVDPETHYCLAVAYTVKNHLSLARNHVRSALEAGIPIERFIAGPRTLLANLNQTGFFNQYLASDKLHLLHGPLLGDITSNTAKIWFRTDQEVKVTLLLFEDRNSTLDTLRFIGMTSEERDYTDVIQIKGLQANTRYRYELWANGVKVDGSAVFKTTVQPGDPLQLKVGFGGGAGYTPWLERMWDTLVTQSFDAFLLLGDNVYIDHPELPDVQAYCYYRRQSRPEFRRFVRQVPIYSIWDDHDFTINDGEGGPEIETPNWKRPVWNLFRNQWANPYYGGGKSQPGCWFDFKMGDIDFFMLDCRYYRENPQEVSEPSMLGKFQKEWLMAKLKASTATFKVIASSVPWAKGTKPGSDDTWDGFPREREEIFSFITEHKIDGVLLISADRHRSDAWKIERPNGYTMYDFMSSKLSNIHTHRLLPGSLLGYNKKCSFGTLWFDTTHQDPSVSYIIKSIDNEEIHRLTIFRSQLEHTK